MSTIRLRRWRQWLPSRRQLWLFGVLAVVFVFERLLVSYAAAHPDWVETVYLPEIYEPVTSVLVTVTAQVPFSVSEWLIAFIWLILLVHAVAVFVSAKPRRWGRIWAAWVAVGAIVFLSFQFLWGLNYLRPAMETRTVEGRTFDEARLEDRTLAVDRLIEQVERTNEAYISWHGLEKGRSQWPYTIESLTESVAIATNDVVRELQGFAIEPATTIKTPRFWPLHQFGAGGMLMVNTLEAQIAFNQTYLTYPFTLAHELAHVHGFAHETDCNLIAVIALRRSDHAWAQYAGEFGFLRYMLRVLGNDHQALRMVYAALHPSVVLDLQRLQVTWDDTWAVSSLGWRIYDAFLRANRIPEGRAAYGRVVELILGFGL